MQFEQMLTTARRVAETSVRLEICGAPPTRSRLVWVRIVLWRTAEAAGDLPGAMLLAERVGHHGAAWETRLLPGHC